MGEGAKVKEEEDIKNREDQKLDISPSLQEPWAFVPRGGAREMGEPRGAGAVGTMFLLTSLALIG